jgi:hypothetical protein
LLDSCEGSDNYPAYKRYYNYNNTETLAKNRRKFSQNLLLINNNYKYGVINTDYSSSSFETIFYNADNNSSTVSDNSLINTTPQNSVIKIGRSVVLSSLDCGINNC